MYICTIQRNLLHRTNAMYFCLTYLLFATCSLTYAVTTIIYKCIHIHNCEYGLYIHLKHFWIKCSLSHESITFERWLPLLSYCILIVLCMSLLLELIIFHFSSFSRFFSVTGSILFYGSSGGM